jgi:putative transposase
MSGPTTSLRIASTTARRSVCIIDEFSRESLAIRVARKLKASDVSDALC